MTQTRRRMLMPLTAALVGVMLTGGGAAGQGGDDSASIAPMASMAPMASAAPMASMEPGLAVVDAWTRESMMDTLAGAAFMVIHNSTGYDDALVGASSPAAAVVEIHQTSMAEDGTMAMAPVDEVPIPAGGEAELEPGGYHLMLIGLVEPLEVGRQIEIGLEFATAAPQTILVPVQALGPMESMHDDADDADDPDDD